MPLSDAVRLGPRAGVGLALLDPMRADATSKLGASSSFNKLVHDLASNLASGQLNQTRGPATVFTFLRGSMIQSRLQVAHGVWQRAVEIFELDPIVNNLNGQFSEDQIQLGLSRIRKAIVSTLVRADDRLGPAKMLIRLGRPNLQLRGNRLASELVELIDGVARQGEQCDAVVREVLEETELGEATRPVAREFVRFVEQSEGAKMAERVRQRFDEFVNLQFQTRCLHPALPARDSMLRRVSLALGTSPEQTRRLVRLFRLTWLCGHIKKTKDLSDFSVKCVTVIPGEANTADRLRPAAEARLAESFETFKRDVSAHPGLRRFCEQYPDVAVRATAHCVALPRPLYVRYEEIGSGISRLAFLNAIRLGSEYTRHFIAAQVLNNGLPRIEAPERTGEFDELFRGIVHLKVKDAKSGGLKHSDVNCFQLGVADVASRIKAVIEQPTTQRAEQVGDLINDVMKEDYAGTVRGVWAQRATNGRCTH